MLESKLRNAARRTATMFFVASVDISKPEEISQALHDFEDQLATLDDEALGSDIKFSNREHHLWLRFEDCSIYDLYDYYHDLVNTFVKEALSDL